ncbi:hypothetical protein BDV93DRAFT_515537 [Ceratobasidium sp. AG-I]|nr:hypothetical protein BDV93DRAFT_515537 [Ceratobasidium sp. AG-I]
MPDKLERRTGTSRAYHYMDVGRWKAHKAVPKHPPSSIAVYTGTRRTHALDGGTQLADRRVLGAPALGSVFARLARSCILYDETGLPNRVEQVYDPLPECVRPDQSCYALRHLFTIFVTGCVPTPTLERQNPLPTPPTITKIIVSMFIPSTSYISAPIGIPLATATASNGIDSMLRAHFSMCRLRNGARRWSKQRLRKAVEKEQGGKGHWV